MITAPRSGDDPGPAAGAPRWVKMLAVIALLLVLLFILLHLLGGGPGMHGTPGDLGGYVPPGGIADLSREHG